MKHVETVLGVKLTSALTLAMTAINFNRPSEPVQLSHAATKRVNTNLCSCCVRTDFVTQCCKRFSAHGP